MSELNLRSYYHDFNETGCRPVDLILQAIAAAAKHYHSTSDWEEGEHWNMIQLMADEAAKQFSRRAPDPALAEAREIMMRLCETGNYAEARAWLEKFGEERTP